MYVHIIQKLVLTPTYPCRCFIIAVRNSIIAYVKEYWSCDGGTSSSTSSTGHLPDRFPTPNHIVQHSSTQNNNSAVMYVMLLGIITISLAFGWVMFRHVYKGIHQPLIVVQDEIVSLGPTSNDDDDSENEGTP